MQIAARLAAAIELLSEIEEKMAARGAPADVLVQSYFRNRRYAGSKDRRAITEPIYAILRGREHYLWALKEVRWAASARSMMVAYLARTCDDAMLAHFGADNPFAPTALTMEEGEKLDHLKRLKWRDAPLEARANIPAWALKGFTARFGKGLEAGAVALKETAPLDIRLNPLKAKGRNLDQILSNSSQVFEKNVFSPIGYRAFESINLGGEKAYSDGVIEVQDEAAQVASLLVDARPGMQVADLCAGAGGKTLVCAATMENSGQIHAFDISGKRLAALKDRMQRAGARNIQVHRIAVEGAGREIAFGPLEAKLDRVVVDAPCTGSGTWRRSPDQRWRFDADALKAQATLQLGLLRDGAALVKTGGRLVYMTCSLLPDENEAVVDAFMAATKGDWKLVDYRAVWADVMATPVPETASLKGACLQLVPHIHATDGFFVAILERL